MEGIGMRFDGVPVLDGVAFDLRPGEVHILAGENGAGKSTLIRILAGVHRPAAGRMEIAGAPTRRGIRRTPRPRASP
jgi:ABC-type sugar transport system ATPase subunit